MTAWQICCVTIRTTRNQEPQSGAPIVLRCTASSLNFRALIIVSLQLSGAQLAAPCARLCNSGHSVLTQKYANYTCHKDVNERQAKHRAQRAGNARPACPDTTVESHAVSTSQTAGGCSHSQQGCGTYANSPGQRVPTNPTLGPSDFIFSLVRGGRGTHTHTNEGTMVSFHSQGLLPTMGLVRTAVRKYHKGEHRRQGTRGTVSSEGQEEERTPI